MIREVRENAHTPAGLEHFPGPCGAWLLVAWRGLAGGLFAERRTAGTSLDDVLAAAKAGKGQFYHYFRTRDELAAAAVGYRCAQVVDGLIQALGDVSSMAGLEQALAGFVAGFEQMGLPGCPIGTLVTEGGMVLTCAT